MPSLITNTTTRPSRAQRLGALLLALAFSLVVSGCASIQSLVSPPVSTTTTVARTAVGPAVTIAFGMCPDPSGSMDRRIVTAAIRAVADTLTDWVPTSGDPRGGRPGTPGLELHLRQVGTASFGPGGEVLAGAISPVPAIPARPEVTDPDFVTANRAWRDAVAAADAAAAQVRVASAALAARVRQVTLTRGGSEIAGCVSALAQTLPAGLRRILVVSDLVQIGQPQIAGDLTGTDVLVVHQCRVATACDGQEREFATSLSARGAASIRFIRPERAGDDVPAFVRGS